MTHPAVALTGVSKFYGRGVHALTDIHLVIGEGEWTAMMGPSGSGKTTLLNLLDGLDRPTEGAIRILGADIHALGTSEMTVFRREKLGLIFQQFHLIPYLTALENVMLAQYYHSMTNRRQALAVLESVQMAHRAHHLPAQLSVGEQQRACIARALINDPQIILADEPTGNLDEENEKKVLDIFRDLHRQGKTLIVVTHDIEVAEAAQRMIVLKHGRIVEDRKFHSLGSLRSQACPGDSASCMDQTAPQT